MSRMSNFISGFSVAIAITAAAAHADVTLQDGTVLSDTPTFIVTYIEADVASSVAVAELIRTQTADSLSLIHI